MSNHESSFSSVPPDVPPSAVFEPASAVASGPARERFVLIETSHAGNVGGAARAIKVMGFSDLVLVRPRDPRVLGRAETIARASGANDILRNARVVDTLEEAVRGMTWLCATAMTPRDFGPPVAAPRAALPDLAKTPHSVAFLFGCERFGMSNEDVYRSHQVLSIPSSPDYGSLNLATAVQLIAYEWRQALGGYDVVPRTHSSGLAGADEVQGLLAHWESALTEIGFLDPAAPRKLMPRLNQLFNRAQLTPEEVHILRGIARAMQRSQVKHSGDNHPA